MGVPSLGVYLSFASAGAPSDPMGPYDEIVVRGARIVGDRSGLGQVIAVRGSKGEWLDADGTNPTAVPNDPNAGLEVRAGSGVMVRFLSDDVEGLALVPEIGPFALIEVETHVVRADRKTLAVRLARAAPWQLTDGAGSAFQGRTKDALVFVAASNGKPIETPAFRTEAAPPPTPRPATPVEEREPSVWVDRVRPEREIYISRPDVPRKR